MINISFNNFFFFLLVSCLVIKRIYEDFSHNIVYVCVLVLEAIENSCEMLNVQVHVTCLSRLIFSWKYFVVKCLCSMGSVRRWSKIWFCLQFWLTSIISRNLAVFQFAKFIFHEDFSVLIKIFLDVYAIVNLRFSCNILIKNCCLNICVFDNLENIF